ncbi:hypothetical protein LJB77_00430 [Ruminococcaceae bacterium OttesenSCG-928-N02]|nr:hypothetical protein [Ruminococcaceae bacterium OttesenSCG-928-N02]
MFNNLPPTPFQLPGLSIVVFSYLLFFFVALLFDIVASITAGEVKCQQEFSVNALFGKTAQI